MSFPILPFSNGQSRCPAAAKLGKRQVIEPLGFHVIEQFHDLSSPNEGSLSSASFPCKGNDESALVRDHPLMRYTNNIHALKKAKGWTIDQAAAAMGLSRGGYIKVERGENRLTSTTIANAARAFGVEESDIVAKDRRSVVNAKNDRASVSKPSPGNSRIPGIDDKLLGQIAAGVVEYVLRSMTGNVPTAEQIEPVARYSIEFCVAKLGADRLAEAALGQTHTLTLDRKESKANARGSTPRQS